MIDPRRRLLTVLAVLGVISGASAQSSLLADIRSGAADRSADSDPSGFVQVGTRTFFTATDARHGRELWAMDPQAFLPRMVLDYRPGPEDGLAQRVQLFPLAGGVVFKPAPISWWFSDGTPAGTHPVLEGMSGPRGDSAAPRSDGQRLWFVDHTVGRGNELYVTDGTVAGTRLVIDLQPGGASGFSGISTLVPDGNGGCWFSANDGVTGRELWFTDGTQVGTRQVLDLEPGPEGSGADPIAMLGSELVFSVHIPGVAASPTVGLWITDGTTANTRRLSRTTAPYGGAIRLGTKLVFVGYEPLAGQEPWVTDGTAAGTFRLADLEPGGDTAYPDGLVVASGRVWFTASDSVHGRELWSTDGTVAGTALAIDLVPGSGDGVFERPLVAGHRLVFSAVDPFDLSIDIWSYDPTTRTALRLVDLPFLAFAPPPLQFAASVGSEVWFSHTDPIVGRELWITDGTPGATQLVFDLAMTAVGSDPQPLLVDSGLRAWFLADDGRVGSEPWITDGTPGGTRLWADLVPGPSDSDPTALVDGDRVYWAISGELFSTDLLGGDRQSLSRSGPFGRELAKVGDRLFFTKPDELWLLDLSTGGTSRVAQFSDPGARIQPFGLTASETDVYFAASRRSTGERGVWISDGTAAGTQVVVPFAQRPTPGSFAMAALGPRNFLVLGETTSTGTFRLFRLDRGVASSLLQFHGLGGRVAMEVGTGQAFFAGAAQGRGMQVWVSDGSLAGTARVTDIQWSAPWLPSFIDELTLAGDLLFFRTDDRVRGSELWVTDGSLAGTRLCRDVLPGSGGSEPQGLIALGQASKVAFTASGVEGRELWVSDGTTSGTRLLEDLDAGAVAGALQTVAVVGSSLVFHGYERLFGAEPRRISLDLVGGFVARSFGGGCRASGGGPAPQAGVTGTPTLGDAGFALTLAGAAPNAASALLIDPGVRLFSAPGCGLWLAGAVVNVPRRSDVLGSAQLGLPVPNDPALAGLLLHAQWLVADPGGALLGQASASSALQVVLGR